jgi:hypothetical protein
MNTLRENMEALLEQSGAEKAVAVFKKGFEQAGYGTDLKKTSDGTYVFITGRHQRIIAGVIVRDRPLRGTVPFQSNQSWRANLSVRLAGSEAKIRRIYDKLMADLG